MSSTIQLTEFLKLCRAMCNGFLGHSPSEPLLKLCYLHPRGCFWRKRPLFPLLPLMAAQGRPACAVRWSAGRIARRTARRPDGWRCSSCRPAAAPRRHTAGKSASWRQWMHGSRGRPPPRRRPGMRRRRGGRRANDFRTVFARVPWCIPSHCADAPLQSFKGALGHGSGAPGRGWRSFNVAVISWQSRSCDGQETASRADPVAAATPPCYKLAVPPSQPAPDAGTQGFFRGWAGPPPA